MLEKDKSEFNCEIAREMGLFAEKQDKNSLGRKFNVK